LAVTVSPTLFAAELMGLEVLAANDSPAANERAVEGLGAAGVSAAGLGFGAGGVLGLVELVAGADGATAVSDGWSFSAADVSTGAICRSRLRLSATAVSLRSPPEHAAMATAPINASMVLDIPSS
jgi:hypothetical protein